MNLLSKHCLCALVGSSAEWRPGQSTLSAERNTAQSAQAPRGEQPNLPQAPSGDQPYLPYMSVSVKNLHGIAWVSLPTEQLQSQTESPQSGHQKSASLSIRIWVDDEASKSSTSGQHGHVGVTRHVGARWSTLGMLGTLEFVEARWARWSTLEHVVHVGVSMGTLEPLGLVHSAVQWQRSPMHGA